MWNPNADFRLEYSETADDKHHVAVVLSKVEAMIRGALSYELGVVKPLQVRVIVEPLRRYRPAGTVGDSNET